MSLQSKNHFVRNISLHRNDCKNAKFPAYRIITEIVRRDENYHSRRSKDIGWQSRRSDSSEVPSVHPKRHKARSFSW